MSAATDVEINCPSGRLGRVNAIFTGRSPHRVERFRGPLSVKAMVHGHAVWETDDGRHRVDAGDFLLLNHGQTYSLEMDAPEGHESFCAFFAEDFARDAAGVAAAADEARLLDREGDGEMPLFEEHVSSSERVQRALTALHRSVRAGAEPWQLVPGFQALFEEILAFRGDWIAGAARIAAAKPATRAELARRVHRANDYLLANFASPLPLARLAREAALSPFHFQRVFRVYFGESPTQRLLRVRIERAKVLLRRTDASVSSIAAQVGFQTPSSFATAFARAAGTTPTRFRADPAEIRKIRKARVLPRA